MSDSMSISHASTSPVSANRGKMLTAALTLYCVLVAVVFHNTLLSMATVWMNSDTYAHGFLIPPICLYLAWRMRDRFHTLPVRPQPWALVLVLGAGLVWLLGNIVDVQVVQRVALVAMLVSGIWAIAGTAVVRFYAFPLGFLFLAVPLGSGLIQPLMVFTAETLEMMVRASGVPVYREGLYLYLPTGTWSVIEECSGLNYVIASVTLGLCYAHLNYISVGRKVVFVVAALILPVIANSLRAYLVVMIGHLSDMRYGTGFDHLVYGWIMFGVVMMLMFWVGGYWRQEPEPAPAGTNSPVQPLPTRSVLLMTALAVLCASAWSMAAFAMSRGNDSIDPLPLALPMAQTTWQLADVENWRWQPPQPGADRQLDQVYTTDTAGSAASVSLHLRQYLQQEQGSELVETFNSWRPQGAVWRVADQRHTVIDLSGPVSVTEVRVSSPPDDLLIWSWYRLDGQNTANHYLVKILEAKQQLLEGHRQGTRIFIATPVRSDRDEARQVLQNFVDDHFSAIETSLDNVNSASDNTNATATSQGPVE